VKFRRSINAWVESFDVSEVLVACKHYLQDVLSLWLIGVIYLDD
jgi:hypothetical protein